MTKTEVKALTKTKQRRRKKLRSPKPEVRARFLDAADKLINEQGFPSLSIDEVAEEAQLSIGSFYLYFENKDDLFANLVVRHTGELREERAKAAAKGKDVFDSFRLGLIAYLQFIEKNAKGFLYFRRVGSIETTVGDLMTWVFSQHALDIRPMLENPGTSDDPLIDKERELAIQTILSSTQHLAGYWLEHKDDFTITEIATHIEQHCMPLIRRFVQE